MRFTGRYVGDCSPTTTALLAYYTTVDLVCQQLIFNKKCPLIGGYVRSAQMDLHHRHKLFPLC